MWVRIMANISINIQGSDELIAAMKKLEKMDDVKRIVKASGARLQSDTQRRMVAAYNRGYSTGATRRSTTLQISDGGMTATVAPHTKYFPYLELGTRFMTARPTLKPAFAKESMKFVQELKGLVK